MAAREKKWGRQLKLLGQVPAFKIERKVSNAQRLVLALTIALQQYSMTADCRAYYELSIMCCHISALCLR